MGRFQYTQEPGSRATSDPAASTPLASGIVSLGASAANGKMAGNLNALYYNVTFASATEVKTVSHKLGRKPIGWAVVRRNAAGVVYEATAPTKSALTLKCSSTTGATTTVMVW